MRLHLPRRRLWRVAIYLGSFAFVLVAADLVLVEVRRTIRPGLFTTRIVAPVQPDGSIDYLMALDELASQGVTHQNNAAVLLLQAFGPGALPTKQSSDGITDRLGMPQLPKDGKYFACYGDYCQQHSGKEEEDPFTSAVVVAGEQKSTPPIRPAPMAAITRQWITDSERPLTLVVEATNRPRMFFPFHAGNRPETLASLQLPQLRIIRDAGRALRTRALMRLEAGDVAGFQQDMVAGHRLARLCGLGWTLVERLIGISMEISTCRAERAAIASGKVPAPAARALAESLAGLGDLAPPSDCVASTERFFVLDILQSGARHRGLGWVVDAASGNNEASQTHYMRDAATCFVPVPWEQTMRETNRFIDGAVVAMKEPTYSQRMVAFGLWEREITKITERHRVSQILSADWPITFFIPNLQRIQERHDSARMESRLTQIALMLVVFQAEHGGYPESLSQLAPAYLPTVPDDLFSEKPLIYSRTSAGYILYSVGPNMKDDGGKPDGKSDDLVALAP